MFCLFPVPNLSPVPKETPREMSGKKLLQRSFIASAIVNVALICVLGYFQSSERMTTAKASSDRKKPTPSATPPALTLRIERVAPSPSPPMRIAATPDAPEKRVAARNPISPMPPRILARPRTDKSASPAPEVSANIYAVKPTPTPPFATSQNGPKSLEPTPGGTSEKNNATGRQTNAGAMASAAKQGDGTATPGAPVGGKPWPGQPATGSQTAAVRSRIASAGTPRTGDSSAKPGTSSPGAGNGVKAGTYRFVPPSVGGPSTGKEGSAGKAGTRANGNDARSNAPGTGDGKGTKTGASNGANGSNGSASRGSSSVPAGGKEGSGNGGRGNGGGGTGSESGANANPSRQGQPGAGSTSSTGSPNGNNSSNGTGGIPNRPGDGQSGQNNGGGSGSPSWTMPNRSARGADDAGYRYNAPLLPSASRPETNSRAGALIQPQTRTTPTPRPVATPVPTTTPTPTATPSPTPTPQASPTPRPRFRPAPTPTPSPTPKPRKAKTEEEPEEKQIAGSYSKRGTVVVDAATVAKPKPKTKKPPVKKPVRRRAVVAKVPEASPSPSPTPSSTPSPKPSVSPTPTPTPTPRPTPTPKPTPKPTATPPPNLQGDGTGLKADYYLGANFEKFLFSRADPKIEFEWGQNAPDARVPAKNAWSVRWTGRVRPRYSDEYTFFTAADDGTRVWVDGKQLINDWTIHGVSEVSGKIRLEGGKLYDIRVEFFEKNGESNCSCKVYWESARQKREFIPQTAFYFPQ
ncbi:MAG: hypothetical protein H8F28_06735 [Fibrella sp.]|nr:hypothetical protein [Armatimonadota bacterium]